MIRGVYALWKCEEGNGMADERGEIVKLDAGAKTRAPMTRRDAGFAMKLNGGGDVYKRQEP